jgi:hypothetical protein
MVVLVALIMAVGVMGNVSAGGNVGPKAMLETYYTFINARQYQAPYQQWVNPPQTYANFAAGYNDTVSVRSFFGGFQPSGPNSVSGRVPAFLQGNKAASADIYTGCYDVRFNPLSSGIGQWQITGATMQHIPYAAIDDAYVTENMINVTCYEQYNMADPYTAGPAGMLVDYFSDVNRRDYSEAFAHWSRPVQTYDQFVAGWSDTLETVMFYGTSQPLPTNGGYDSVRIPVVLMGYGTAGNLNLYTGCIGAGPNPYTREVWSITSARLQAVNIRYELTEQIILQWLASSCW